jgi:hypothetical protein
MTVKISNAVADKIMTCLRRQPCENCAPDCCSAHVSGGEAWYALPPYGWSAYGEVVGVAAFDA